MRLNDMNEMNGLIILIKVITRNFSLLFIHSIKYIKRIRCRRRRR